MNQLTLSIKQKFFDQILSGEKKEEVREVRPNNSGRYVFYVADSVEYKNDLDIPDDAKDVEVKPIEYDTLKLLTGEYKGKRPFIIVEVVGTEVVFLTDEDGNDIVYEYEGEEFVMTQVIYSLGNIIEKSNV